jgi:hypothetical protein
VALEEIAGVGAEQNREAVGAELVRFGQCQQFDEAAGELHDVVMRAPWVAVARADGKTEIAIERGRGVEITHSMNDMVEAARHGHASTSRRLRRRPLMMPQSAAKNKNRPRPGARFSSRRPRPAIHRTRGGGMRSVNLYLRLRFLGALGGVYCLIRAAREVAKAGVAIFVGIHDAHFADLGGPVRLEQRLGTNGRRRDHSGGRDRSDGSDKVTHGALSSESGIFTNKKRRHGVTSGVTTA